MQSAVHRGTPSLRYLLAWDVIAITPLLFLPVWRAGLPLWHLPRAQWLPFLCLVAAFLLSAAIAASFHRLARWQAAPLAAVCTAAVFGLVLLGFFLKGTDYSRAITLTMFACAVLLVPAPYVVGPSRHRAALGALIAAVAAGPYALSLAEQASSRQASLIKTEYYNLEVDTYSSAIPHPVVQGGGLATIGDHYLLVTGDGRFYLFGWGTPVEHLAVTPLPFRAPINGDAFARAAGRPWATPASYVDPAIESGRAGSEILNSEWFRVYSVLVQETGDDARLFVSHNFWHSDRDCWTERVSVLQANRQALLAGTAEAEWETLYETQPCLPVTGPDRRHGIPFVGYFGGGRMALLDAQTLLLTVGDFGFDGAASTKAQAQDPSTSYGKTIAIRIADGRTTLFTLGHRNPEGLSIDSSGVIWSTEHGPQGGDELNRLVRDANYGWPYATYGTDYASFAWPLNKPEAEWHAYRSPVFAWVPSIAVTNLIAVERDLFTQWRGDLLIASLKAQTLFRARIRNGQVAYVEPIVIGSRVRDLVEGHDGRIVLWTDDHTLISLRPKQSTTGDALFAERCNGCHQSVQVSGNRIGPSLSGVVGRRTASLTNYPDYSSCLRRLGGMWTEERLDAFLTAPRALCPGTSMDFAGIASPSERSAIIRHLGTLRH
ncbi:PQQ-dependent sugar dehydrogenase [Microvirga terricola]|uniref:Cytochrome c domain-containing protein n=1 Tax=Microvirga terricola TaxID=2719797 RepID=A0ABX0VAX4_9HYPH|nr:PQQ-dependent sugar dehydrogenase [Microvirga terricola]NIX77003.1 hypothetical protein [Microvirga terricola]